MYIARIGPVLAYDDIEGMDYALSLLTQGKFGACAADLSPATDPGPNDNNLNWQSAQENDNRQELDRFVPTQYLPQGRGDYPLRQCNASGLWGAPSSMVQVDGVWFLRDYAPKHHVKQVR